MAVYAALDTITSMLLTVARGTDIILVSSLPAMTNSSVPSHWLVRRRKRFEGHRNFHSPG